VGAWFSQERIDHGVLTQWTKGFGASGVEGQDAAELFRKSLRKFVRRQPKPYESSSRGS